MIPPVQVSYQLITFRYLCKFNQAELQSASLSIASLLLNGRAGLSVVQRRCTAWRTRTMWATTRSGSGRRSRTAVRSASRCGLKTVWRWSRKTRRGTACSAAQARPPSTISPLTTSLLGLSHQAVALGVLCKHSYCAFYSLILVSVSPLGLSLGVVGFAGENTNSIASGCLASRRRTSLPAAARSAPAGPAPARSPACWRPGRPRRRSRAPQRTSSTCGAG